MKKNLSGSLPAFAFMLIISTAILAQTTATISGHVTDPQGASVKGATVTLYARDSRVLFTTTTDATGTYRFEGIPPSEYVVAVDAAGFARAARPLRSEHGSTTLDISLEIAGFNSEVI